MRSIKTTLGLLMLTIFALSIGGCATTYQKAGFTGGFSEVRLAENRFKVSFKGNAFTSREKAKDYTLLRSAELCQEKGYKYFVIINEDNYIKTVTTTTPLRAHTTGSTYGNAYNSRTTFSGGGSNTLKKPRSTNVIDCYNSKPVGAYAYEIKFIISSIRK